MNLIPRLSTRRQRLIPASDGQAARPRRRWLGSAARRRATLVASAAAAVILSAGLAASTATAAQANVSVGIKSFRCVSYTPNDGEFHCTARWIGGRPPFTVTWKSNLPLGIETDEANRWSQADGTCSRRGATFAMFTVTDADGDSASAQANNICPKPPR
ncbi:hypothetical protein ACFWYW_13915 [Nonomuraea sp. NPDC059023]|uniref:hypothetical protein n=1 Tax=unclassified Nonomuraea TaxID=2593643 RepID=UPI0036A3004A